MRLLRMAVLSAKIGKGRSSNYAEIKNGTLPPPIKYGDTSCWPEHEIDVVVAARIAGKTDDEIRELVKEIVANRANALNEVLQRAPAA